MAGYKKWILGGLGLLVGGPAGALIGYLMGSVLDEVSLEELKTVYNNSGGFGISLLILSAAVAKADGKVSKSEIIYIRNFLKKQFGEAEAETSIRIFDELLRKDFSVQHVTLQIREFLNPPSRLQLLYYLFGIAQADGRVDRAEVEIIHQIAFYLDISKADFASILSMYYKETDSAYNILEVSHDATDDEIKKAFRKMAVKYHPDKVAHLGEKFRESANKKFQKLLDAYETIKKERGMH